MRSICTAGVPIALAVTLAACTVTDRHDRSTPTRADHKAVDTDNTQAPSTTGDTGRPDAEPRDAEARPARDTRKEAVPVIAPQHSAEVVHTRIAKLIASAPHPLLASEAGYYMDVQEANLRKALSGDGVLIRHRGSRIVLVLSGKTGFDTGETAIGPNARDALAGIAHVLTKFPRTFVAIHGYTDAVGEAPYNDWLSRQRGINIARRLVAGGVNADRIIVVGHGESASAPAAGHDSSGDRLPARRMEIRLIPMVQ